VPIADVAELADAQVSGTCELTLLKVRLLSSALPITGKDLQLFFLSIFFVSFFSYCEN
jgi:hypothetical protein